MERETQVRELKAGDFDVLVIGGGATGTGVALDAVTRGLKTALVERNDFSSGTSSRSTKLIHGGVRYLEQAVLKFDRTQFNLVRDALHERATLLRIAPHLAHPLAILTPLYNRLDVPYYRSGLKLYDHLAGKHSLHKSFFVGAKEAQQKFPMLKGENLRGGVVYYDGQFDDARMNTLIAMTAVEHGAKVANHVEVKSLLHHQTKVVGAKLRDCLSGEEWEIRARVVVNATGPYSDSIRVMDMKSARPLLTASSGAHIVLDKKYSPPETGLLIPKTEDGRVLFLLPWLGHTLVGTTDHPAKIVDHPKAESSDIDYILRQMQDYFGLSVKKKEILASWSGLRPLVSDPRAADTARLSRDHIIQISDSGLITVTGGKWTTYRKMAEDTVDHITQFLGNIFVGPCCTEKLVLRGGKDYAPDGWRTLVIDHQLPEDVAKHLHRAYGTLATKVLGGAKGNAVKRLDPGYPFLEQEISYVIKEEMARNIVDILARRLRLTFLNTKITEKVAPRVAEIAAKELGWDEKTKQAAIKELGRYL